MRLQRTLLTVAGAAVVLMTLYLGIAAAETQHVGTTHLIAAATALPSILPTNGPVNDGNPVGFRFAPQQDRKAQYSSTQVKYKPLNVNETGTTGCNNSHSCMITIQYLETPLPVPCTVATGICQITTCPADAQCIDFTGPVTVDHLDKDGTYHTQEDMNVTGTIIIQ